MRDVVGRVTDERPLRLWIGCSGGADSVALLGLLRLLADGDGLVLGVGHVDHGLRAESAREAEHVRELALRLGVEAHVSMLSLVAGPGLPARAREARRAALDEGARAFGAHAIALGHTATDRAETVLLHLVRGASLPGLAAMPAIDRDDARTWIRPLLALARDEVRSLCDRLSLPFVDDPTNDDRTHPRVAVRHEVLPVLRRLRDGADLAIASAADAVGEALAAIDDIVRAELVGRGDALGRVRVDDIAVVPRAVRTRLVREVCLAGGVDADAVGRRAIGDIDRALLERGQRREWSLRGGRRIVIDDLYLWVEASTEPTEEDSSV